MTKKDFIFLPVPVEEDEDDDSADCNKNFDYQSGKAINSNFEAVNLGNIQHRGGKRISIELTKT